MISDETKNVLAIPKAALHIYCATNHYRLVVMTALRQYRPDVRAARHLVVPILSLERFLIDIKLSDQIEVSSVTFHVTIYYQLHTLLFQVVCDVIERVLIWYTAQNLTR